MRIAIDYTPAMQETAGAGSYTRKLVAALLRQDSDNHYLLLANGLVSPTRPFPAADNVRVRTIALPERFPAAAHRSWRFPIPSLFARSLDIYHSPDHLLPPLSRRVRKIITIQNLAFLEYEQTDEVAPEHVAYLRRTMPEALARADAIITTSEELRQTLMQHFQTPDRKIAVSAPGVAPYFRRITDPLLLNATRHKFDLRDPFVLTVGRREKLKNQLDLIKAFQSLAKKKSGPAQLVIAGEAGWQAEKLGKCAEELKIDKKVRFLGQVSDLELITLYSMAALCVFPARYAGSGVAALEAMACGAPVICSNIAPLARVVEDGALQIEPQNSDAIAQAISRLLGDTGLRDTLREKGFIRARQYAWDDAAQQILALYRRIHAGQTDFADKGVRV